MKLVEQQENEMEMLLNEIPRAAASSSPRSRHGQRYLVDPPSSHLRGVSGGAADGRHGRTCAPDGSSSSSAAAILIPGTAEEPLMEEFSIIDGLAAMHVGGEGGDAWARSFRDGYRDAVEKGLLEEGNYGVIGRSATPLVFAPSGDGQRMASLDAEPHWSGFPDAWPGNSRASGVPSWAYSSGFSLDPMSVPYQDDTLDHLGLAPAQNLHCRGIRNERSVSSSDISWPPLQTVDQNRNLDFPNVPNAANAMLLNPGILGLDGQAAALNDHNAQFLSLTDVESFGCEDSLIIHGKGLEYPGRNRREFRRERRRSQQQDHRLSAKGSAAVDTGHMCSLELTCPSILPLNSNDSMAVNKCIYCMAKDQQGCRTLQRLLLEERLKYLDAIYSGIINHLAELMVNRFGNYLMQKLLCVCNEEQRLGIIVMLTRDPMQLVSISVNPHGTRTVQKLIETLKTRQQITLVTAALEPWFLHLTVDVNGNHVINRCLTSLAPQYNKFIFNAAAKYSVRMATHQHGCCILQRCIDHSTGEHQVKLLMQISAHGYLLAVDAFGNYVVQYILKLGNPLANATLASQFQGHYVTLSTQKFSSNVVEKCLENFGEEGRAKIIFELLSVPRFEQLLQDQYANYVIQSAITNAKGAVRAALDAAILPHASALRSNPHCKRIFSTIQHKQ